MRSLMAALCGVILAFPTPAPAQEATGAEAAIQAGTQAWMAGWNSGDAASIAALYAEDAVLMPPGAEPAKGSAAIQASLAAAVAEAGGSQLKIKPAEVITDGEWAVETGTFVETAADGSHKDHGKYMAVWKKVDGKWMLARDIWNSSMH